MSPFDYQWINLYNAIKIIIGRSASTFTTRRLNLVSNGQFLNFKNLFFQTKGEGEYINDYLLKVCTLKNNTKLLVGLFRTISGHFFPTT